MTAYLVIFIGYTQHPAYFSIGQLICESVNEDDFRLEFGHIDGAAAVNLDEPFAGWNSSVTQSPANFLILL